MKIDAKQDAEWIAKTRNSLTSWNRPETFVGGELFMHQELTKAFMKIEALYACIDGSYERSPSDPLERKKSMTTIEVPCQDHLMLIEVPKEAPPSMHENIKYRLANQLKNRDKETVIMIYPSNVKIRIIELPRKISNV